MSAPRKIEELVKGTSSAKVYWSSLLQEYVVKFYKAGFHLIDSDYFTDDKDDALGTAKWQLGIGAS